MANNNSLQQAKQSTLPATATPSEMGMTLPTESNPEVKEYLDGVIKLKTFFKDGSIVLQYEVDKETAKIISRITHNENGVPVIKHSNTALKTALKHVYTKYPTHKDWDFVFLKIEDRLRQFVKAGFEDAVDGLSAAGIENLAMELIGIFINPIVEFEDENGRIIDGIYKYSCDDIESRVNDLLEYFNEPLKSRLYKSLSSMLPLLKAMPGGGFSDDILYVFITFDYKDEKPEIYTYIASDITGLYKIGKTTDIAKRMASLKVGNTTLKLEFFIKGDFEKMLHEKYACRCEQGEWFSLYKKDLEYIKSLGV